MITQRSISGKNTRFEGMRAVPSGRFRMGARFSNFCELWPASFPTEGTELLRRQRVALAITSLVYLRGPLRENTQRAKSWRPLSFVNRSSRPCPYRSEYFRV